MRLLWPLQFRQPFRFQSSRFSSTKDSKPLEVIKNNDLKPVENENNAIIEEKGSFNANPSSLTSSSVPQTSVFKDRTALIYTPTRNVMQSGRAQTKFWQIKFNSNVPRWENPLMGWTSSRDPVQAMQLKFKSKEEAVEYAKEQGWAYEVKQPHEPVQLKPKSYADNFKYSSGKLKMIKTK